MVDERIERINGQVSFFCLMLTQVGLGGILFYKRYVQGLPASETNLLAGLLGLSIAVYWTFRLYLSGILPLLSFKQLLTIYLVAVAFISVPTYLIHGWPEPGRWYEVLFPSIGVAIVLAIYSLVSYLGKRRLDRYLSS
jgi:hypothetical protein